MRHLIVVGLSSLDHHIIHHWEQPVESGDRQKGVVSVDAEAGFHGFHVKNGGPQKTS